MVPIVPIGTTWGLSRWIGHRPAERYAGPVEAIVDTSKRPLCRITVGVEPSVECFDGILTKIADELSRHRAICVLANAEHTTHIEFAHVRRLVEFGEQNHMMLEAYIRALAFVIPSPTVRGLTRLAFQIKPPPHPVKIFSNEPAATAYLMPFLLDI
jgi:hypothetical protein